MLIFWIFDLRFASFCFQYDDNIYYVKYIRGEWWGGRNSDKQDYIIMSGGGDSAYKVLQQHHKIITAKPASHPLISIVWVRGGRTIQDRNVPLASKPPSSASSTIDKPVTFCFPFIFFFIENCVEITNPTPVWFHHWMRKLLSKKTSYCWDSLQYRFRQ